MAPMAGMAENVWIWLEIFFMARQGWKLIEMSERAQHFLIGWTWLEITRNGLICLERAGMARIGCKWLKTVGNCWTGWGWLKFAGNSCEWLDMAGIA